MIQYCVFVIAESREVTELISIKVNDLKGLCYIKFKPVFDIDSCYHV